jgi:hypothetical protein
VITGFNVLYAGRVLPGVSVAGVDLSGLQPEQAARIQAQLDYPTRRLLFKDGESSGWPPPRSVSTWTAGNYPGSLRFGRQGDPVTRLFDQFWPGTWGFPIADVRLR